MYRAPEMQTLAPRSGYLTEKTDIWALGCIFYQLCFFRHPFETTTRVAFPKRHSFGADVETFIMYMFDPDPEARPSIAQLLPMAQALHQHKPLPPYEVPPEVLEIRREREEENRQRELKQQQRRQETPKQQRPATGQTVFSNAAQERRDRTTAAGAAGSCANSSGDEIRGASESVADLFSSRTSPTSAPTAAGDDWTADFKFSTINAAPIDDGLDDSFGNGQRTSGS
jgi:serine/threonine protein kinase